MGMSTHILGVRDLDVQFNQMAKVKEACDAAGIEYPVGVTQYFKYPGESIENLRREMQEIDIEGICLKLDVCEGSDTWEIQVKDIPKECKAIRFYNSY